jgi:hypothetical protein
MRLDSKSFALLTAIVRGETAFQAAGGTPEDLNQFRDRVRSLKRLAKQGHIEILELRSDSALVSLTDQGRRLLADERSRQ